MQLFPIVLRTSLVSFNRTSAFESVAAVRPPAANETNLSRAPKRFYFNWMVTLARVSLTTKPRVRAFIARLVFAIDVKINRSGGCMSDRTICKCLSNLVWGMHSAIRINLKAIAYLTVRYWRMTNINHKFQKISKLKISENRTNKNLICVDCSVISAIVILIITHCSGRIFAKERTFASVADSIETFPEWK